MYERGGVGKVRGGFGKDAGGERENQGQVRSRSSSHERRWKTRLHERRDADKR